ncbi:hypothetical protein STEG23_030830, partial [Scotinomys teguina]
HYSKEENTEEKTQMPVNSKPVKQTMVVYIYNASIQEAESGLLRSQGQPGHIIGKLSLSHRPRTPSHTDELQTPVLIHFTMLPDTFTSAWNIFDTATLARKSRGGNDFSKKQQRQFFMTCRRQEDKLSVSACTSQSTYEVRYLKFQGGCGIIGYELDHILELTKA